MKQKLLKGTKTLLLAAFMAGTMSASALTLDLSSPYYLGSWVPHAKGGEAGEEQALNYLIDLTPAGSGDYSGPNPNLTGVSFTRQNNYVQPPVLPNAVYADKDETAPYTDLVLGNYLYVTGKYGTSVHAWYLGDLTGQHTLIESLGQGLGLSHVTVYNQTPSTVTVPDGGSIALLLGTSLSGLALIRRKLA